jgi:hypothetical protein
MKKPMKTSSQLLRSTKERSIKKIPNLRLVSGKLRKDFIRKTRKGFKKR